VRVHATLQFQPQANRELSFSLPSSLAASTVNLRPPSVCMTVDLRLGRKRLSTSAHMCRPRQTRIMPLPFFQYHGKNWPNVLLAASNCPPPRLVPFILPI
jgi:hypothetical protein